MIYRLARTLLALAAAVPLWLVAPVRANAQGAQPAAGETAIPDTPAGHVLRQWLDAFNSADPATMDAYYKRYEPDKTAETQMSFRAQTGGFDLVSIERGSPLSIVFLLKERASDRQARGRLDLASAEGSVSSFALQGFPKGATAADFAIDGATRRRVVDSAIADLNAYYVYPEVAKQMGDAVRAEEKRGAYDRIIDGFDLADTLTADFRGVSHDKHLRVMFSPMPIPNQPPGQNPAADTAYRNQMASVNCGFDRVERLPGNVGYLKFDFFGAPEICGPTVVAAMNFLAHVDALIIDMRQNGGGSAEMVQFIASYLFDEPAHLNDMWERTTNATQQFWTLPYVPGNSLGTVPVYVLTSKRTFSGAEEFSYDLKNLKRATIVGEVTGGGAHPVSGHRIDAHFMIGVPFGHPINPVSKTDWEGVGVQPDVKVVAADALTTAEKLAADTLAHAHRLMAKD